MADTTISQLPNGVPTSNAVLPYTQGNTTYSTVLSNLDAYRFFIKANCTGTATENMPNVQAEPAGGAGTTMNLPLNTIDSAGTNPNWNSALNVANNSIVIPEYGFYMGRVKIEGYVASNAWNIRAFAIVIYNSNDNSVYESWGYFNCVYAGFSNTHFAFNPSASFWANAGANIKVQYQIFSAAGPSKAMIQPIYNTASLSLIKLN
jgi:hypothetical protein